MQNLIHEGFLEGRAGALGQAVTVTGRWRLGLKISLHDMVPGALNVGEIIEDLVGEVFFFVTRGMGRFRWARSGLRNGSR